MSTSAKDIGEASVASQQRAGTPSVPNVPNGSADDSGTQERNRELARTKLEADIADQQKRLAEARKAIREASLPVTEVKPLEGKITVANDTTPIESEILAHEAIEAIASEIAGALCTTFPDTRIFVVHQEGDAAALTALGAFRMQIEALRSAYEAVAAAARAMATQAPEVTTQSVGLGIAAGTALAKSALDFLALFRSDVEIRGHELTLDEAVIVSEIAARLPKTKRLHYPRLYPSTVMPDEVRMTDKILGELTQLRDQREQAASAVARVEANSRTELDSRLSMLTTQHQTLEQALFARDAAGGSPPIIAIVQAAVVQALLKESGKLLYVKVQKARGSTRTERWLWRHKLSHSGGAVVTLMVFDEDGAIALSDTISARTGYREFPVHATPVAVRSSDHRIGVTLSATDLPRTPMLVDGGQRPQIQRGGDSDAGR